MEHMKSNPSLNTKQIKLQGIVTEAVTQDENRSQYKIISNGKEYEIISTGRQAIKDNLFIRKGQHMEIEGNETTEHNTSKEEQQANKKVLTERTQILLKQRSGEKYE